MPMPHIRESAPRDTVQARLPDGRIFEAPPGTSVGAILDAARRPGERPMAAILNGHLEELGLRLRYDSDVVPVDLRDADGVRIYRRSVILLLVTAAAELFPDAEILVEHMAASSAALFCSVLGRTPLSQADLERVATRMRQLVDQGAPITRVEVPIGEAMAFFEARGDHDKVRLLAHRADGTVALYELAGRRDYLQGYLVPSAACLTQFALHAYPPGFMLQFPHTGSPDQLEPIQPYPKLFQVFEEYGDWLSHLGVRSVGALNDAIERGRMPEISLVSEALQSARIARIADEILSARDRVRLVAIAGPSSSGKTTFSKRLAVMLMASGLRPFPVALDDYFLERDQTPRDEHGNYDYESIRALDLPLFNEHLRRLIDGDEVTLSRYNFKTGRRELGETVRLGPSDLLLIEGIHGLNPELVTGLGPDQVYRVYVSALTQLNLDRHNRVSTTDCRLIRRLVRDAATRGYDAAATLERWPSVHAGEKLFIFPFQERADAMFNSALPHELAVLRRFAEPLLLQVRGERVLEHLEARRLLSFLQWFRPAPLDFVPTNSILREFAGGSVLETFTFVVKHGATGRF